MITIILLVALFLVIINLLPRNRSIILIEVALILLILANLAAIYGVKS